MGGPILAQEEIKTIFGSIPDIYEVHTRIKVMYPQTSVLCKNRRKVLLLTFWSVDQNDLEELLTDWSENRSVGNIILKYVSFYVFIHDVYML